jgi:hypothetical protein
MRETRQGGEFWLKGNVGYVVQDGENAHAWKLRDPGDEDEFQIFVG